MHIKKTTTLVSAVFLSLFLSACGGGASSPLDPKPSSTGASATPNSSGAASSINTTLPAKIGRGSGNDFVTGEIALGNASGELAAGGTVSLTVNIVSSTNNLVIAPLEVTFNSRCYAADEATLSSNGTPTNKVSTEIGQARITYTANGCVGGDEITATAVLNGEVQVARVTVNVAQDIVQSIRFIDAVPSKIFLKDSGGAQTSKVRFLVLGSTGAPIKDVALNFTLSTSVGGIALTTASATTDNSGHASTTVQAGSIPTAVEVITTEPNSGVTARSNKLSIGTGMPDQNSMSIAASRFNPPGWNRDGEEVNVTVRLADAFNNPPPDGTSVLFTTEGGVIDPNCTTLNGTCFVVWKSQNSRPSNGRVTILATTVGNESFTDTDGDGLYSNGIDIFNSFNPPGNGDCDPNVPVSTASSNGSDAPCDDLSEAYVDKNENGKHDNGEEFVDFNLNGKHDAENGIYNGVLCKGNNGCTKEPVNIREHLILSMSSDMPYSEDGLLIGQPEAIEMGVNESYSFFVTLADINGNAMPIGTTVSLITATASDVTISHNMPSSGVANTLNPTGFSVTLKGSKTERPSGSFGIAIKSPHLETVYTTRIVAKPLENTSAVYVGKSVGATFVSGVIDIGIGDSVLSPGGSTSLSVNLVDADFKLTPGSAQVSFTSRCVRNGLAKLTNSSDEETNTADTQTGRATIIYTATGCTGTDEVTATATLPSLVVNTATATLEIVEVSAQNIAFNKAEPAQISLKGAGGTEISRVSFIVNGPSGLPLAGVPVELTLNNNVGGICLSNVSPCAQTVELISDVNGYVTALVQAGNIATTVRVTATAEDNLGNAISTQSSRLVISTGIPDQDSMSISASEYNPPSYINGYEVDVTIGMADAFNNPVPIGTTVNFTASGGLIQDSCETNALSSCTVKWIAQSPKPASGKVTILATSLGNESFIDRNGNGQYDVSDTFTIGGSTCGRNAPVPTQVDPLTACDDLGEAYLDSNQNGIYDLTDGYFVDIFSAGGVLGKDGIRTPGNGIYDGALCSNTAAGAGNCTKNSVTVREDIIIVLSTGVPAVVDSRLPGQPGVVSLALDEEATLSITLQDTNGNSMPAGTEVTIEDADAENVAVIMNPEPVIVPTNVTGPTSFTIFLKADSILPASGRFRVQVKTPDKGGVIGTTRSYTTRIN